jgi:hypothetical protein
MWSWAGRGWQSEQGVGGVNLSTPSSKVHATQTDTPKGHATAPHPKLVRKLLNQGIPQASGKNCPQPLDR